MIGTTSTWMGVGTLAKLLADLRNFILTRKGKEKDEILKDFLEWRRRQDHDALLERLDNIKDKLIYVEDLLHLLVDMQDQHVERILTAFRTGNYSQLPGEGTLKPEASAALDQLADQLDVPVQRLFDAKGRVIDAETQFESDYVIEVEKRLRFFRTFGIREVRDVTQDLDLAYVTLQLHCRASEGAAAPRQADEALKYYRQLAILGPAGSGKTTLLRWIAIQCARDWHDANGVWSNGIPLMVPLRSIPSDQHGQPSLSILHEYVFGHDQWGVKPPPLWIDHVFEQKRAVLLLDGLDEVSSKARLGLWNWVRSIRSRFPGNRIYISSRPLYASHANSEEWAPPSSFNTAAVSDMGDDDLSLFIEKWHLATAADVTDSLLLKELNRSQTQLPAKLADPANRRVRELCKTPLLAGMVCALHWREGGYLPSKRGDLYQRCCEMLVEDRDRQRLINNDGRLKDISKSSILPLLSRLAMEMMRNKRPDVEGQHIEATDAEAEGWLAEHLAKVKDATLQAAAPNEALTFLVERSGILRRPSDGFVDFHHRTFQEYLAACAAFPMKQVGFLVKQAGDDQWRETIILAANTPLGGLPVATQLVSQLLASADSSRTLKRTYIALAAACADHAAENLDDEAIDKLDAAIKSVLPPRSEHEADSLSHGGEAILKWLDYEALKSKVKRSAKARRMCVRAIARVGSSRAIAMLTEPNGYSATDDIATLSELCYCPGINPLQLPSVLNLTVANGYIPPALSPYVTDLIPLSTVPGLSQFTIRDCPLLTTITPLGQLSTLQQLRIEKCPRLEHLSLSAASGIAELALVNCPSLRSFHSLSDLAYLRHLLVRNCPHVSSDPILTRLKSRGVSVFVYGDGEASD